MNKNYAVLYNSGDPISILGENNVKQLTGVDALFSDMQKALDWITKYNDGVLIISMPIEEPTRRVIAEKLLSHDKQCIAIDPGQLYSGSKPLFRDSRPITGSILSQIRDLMD